MGYMKHEAVIVTTTSHSTNLPDIDAFRASLPERFRPLVIGPVDAVCNSYVTYAFLPDGSKEGWDESERGDEYRRQFVDLFNSDRWQTGGCRHEWVYVAYGSSHRADQGVTVGGTRPEIVAADDD